MALWTARKLLSDKKAELESASTADDDAQLEITELEKNLVFKENQWSATKEVYHREYGPIAEENNATPVTEIKGKTSICMLRYCSHTIFPDTPSLIYSSRLYYSQSRARYQDASRPDRQPAETVERSLDPTQGNGGRGRGTT